MSDDAQIVTLGDLKIGMTDEGEWCVIYKALRPLYICDNITEAVDFMTAVELGWLEPKVSLVEEENDG